MKNKLPIKFASCSILKRFMAILPLGFAMVAGTLGIATMGRAQTAAFAGLDTTTQGNWTGHYGVNGYTIIGSASVTPSYSAPISGTGFSSLVWQTLTAQDVIDLQNTAAAAAQAGDVPNAGNNAVAASFNVRYALNDLYKSPSTQDRIAGQWHNTAGIPGSSFTIDVPLTDTNIHQVALYFLDFDKGSRFQTIRVENAVTGAVLDTHKVSYFTFGQYLIWNVTGHVKLVVTQDSGTNAVVSGIFFDPPASPRPTPALGAINVTQYGASGNGSTDNTAAFQKALDAAGRTGAMVRVPAGRYSFGSASNPNPTLNVPAQVALEGVNAGERNYLGYSNGIASGDVTADHGTVFLVRAGANGSVPFLTLNANSALRCVTFYYPNQVISTTPGWSAPTPYPTTVYMAGNNASVDYVCGINPYIFITKSLSGNSVRTNVRHVSGQPLSRGLVADADPDVTHYEDIHFGQTWDNNPAMAAWMLANAWGISVYRGDDLKFTDCSAVGYSRGFYFGFSHIPTTIDLSRGVSGPYSGGLQGCTAENCQYGLWVDATRQDTDMTFHGCAFSSNPNTNGTAVMISNGVDTGGNIVFDGCRFWQAKGPLLINQARAGGNVTIVGCSFDAWGTGSSGLDPASAAIVCGDTGNPSSPSAKTLIVDCTFNVDQYTYTFTPGVAGMLFEGNTTVNGAHVQSLGALPASPTGVYYKIQPSYNTALALDDVNFGNTDGSMLQLYQDTGASAQRWMLIPNTDGTYGISPACALDLGLDDYGGSTASQTPADLWQLYPGDPHTAWNLIPTGIADGSPVLTVTDGTYNINPVSAPQLTLDASGAGNSNGTPIDLYTQNGTPAQSWLLSYQAGYIQDSNN